MQPSHPRSCFLKAVFSPALCQWAENRGLLVLVSQSLAEHSLETHPFPFPLKKGNFYWEVSDEDHTKVWGTSAPASIFLRPQSRDLHFPAEEFKLPPDAQMKLQGGRTPLTSRWKQRGCKDGEGD